MADWWDNPERRLSGGGSSARGVPSHQRKASTSSDKTHNEERQQMPTNPKPGAPIGLDWWNNPNALMKATKDLNSSAMKTTQGVAHDIASFCKTAESEAMKELHRDLEYLSVGKPMLPAKHHPRKPVDGSFESSQQAGSSKPTGKRAPAWATGGLSNTGKIEQMEPFKQPAVTKTSTTAKTTSKSSGQIALMLNSRGERNGGGSVEVDPTRNTSTTVDDHKEKRSDVGTRQKQKRAEETRSRPERRSHEKEYMEGGDDLRPLLEPGLNVYVLLEVESAVLQSLSRKTKFPPERTCNAADIFIKLSKISSRQLVSPSSEGHSSDRSELSFDFALLGFSHLLLLEMAESDRVCFTDSLLHGNSEPWRQVLSRPYAPKSLREYAGFLKLKANLLQQVPEIEGNFSLQRFECRVGLEMCDNSRKAENARRVQEIISQTTGEALLRFGSVGTSILRYLTEEGQTSEMSQFVEALVCLDVNNSLLLIGYLVEKLGSHVGDLMDRMEATKSKLKPFVKKVRMSPFVKGITNNSTLRRIGIDLIDPWHQDRLRVHSMDVSSILCTYSNFLDMHEAFVPKRQPPRYY